MFPYRPLALFLCGICLQTCWAGRPSPNRYLYVVTCGARIDKLDTILEKKISSYDLARAKQNLIPQVAAGQTFDGCLTDQAIYDHQTFTFYTLAPQQARLDSSGTQQYQILGFKLPSLTRVSAEPAGSGTLEDKPVLAFRNGHMVAVRQSDLPPIRSIDLSSYLPSKVNQPNEPMESSGDKTLVDLFGGDSKPPSLAVVDSSSKTLSVIHNNLMTTPGNVHLSPGGLAVLVEEVTSDSTSSKTGKATLFDSSNGLQLGTFADEQIKSLFFLSMSPNGKAIYHSGEQYFFLEMHKTFADQPVIHLQPDQNNPASFYAANE